jgi:hypothetical protein
VDFHKNQTCLIVVILIFVTYNYNQNKKLTFSSSILQKFELKNTENKELKKERILENHALKSTLLFIKFLAMHYF